jgi:hypothetical protein
MCVSQQARHTKFVGSNAERKHNGWTPKLPDVMRLRVRNYSLKSNPTGARYIGWIAQEVEQVFPSLVIEQVNIDADGNEIRLKGIKESALIPILVKAIQEQQVIIDDLKTRLDKGGL